MRPKAAWLSWCRMTQAINDTKRKLEPTNVVLISFAGTHAQMSTSTGMLRSAAAVVLDVPLMSPSSRADNGAKIESRVANGIEANKLPRTRRGEVFVTSDKGSQ